MMAGRTGGITAALLLALGAPLAGQALRFTGVDFVVARYAASGSVSRYAARRVGPGMIMGGVVANPRTLPATAVVGVGTDWRPWRRADVVAIVAGADAGDGASARLYLLPRFSIGRVGVSATATAYHPIGGAGPRQAAVNPLTVAVRVAPGLHAGLVATLETREGRFPVAGLGPGAQWRGRGWALTVETTAAGVRAPLEVRAAFAILGSRPS
jgi:hypothetical protein